MDHRNIMRPSPAIVITEQPKQRGMRFRYECEGRSAGSIPGELTTQDRKTWPTIQIRNYTGEVTVRVSLVSKDTPPRPHPHSLVGKDCHNGICTVRVTPETQMSATFSNLGIQCVKRKEVAEALKLRHSLQVDPFNSNQNNDPQAVDIDLNIVKLCFEAFISQGNNQHIALHPVLSNAIFDKKATSSSLLRICRVDKSFGSCKGGDEVYLLCDKVQKDDIQICFYQVDDRRGLVWEAYGEFSPTDVHRQVAIVFRTPPYQDPNLNEAIKVLFQLKRTSDGETSDSKDFTYLPQYHDQPQLKNRKRDYFFNERHNISQTTKSKVQEAITRKAIKVDSPMYYDRNSSQMGMPSVPSPLQRMQPDMPASFPARPFPLASQPIFNQQQSFPNLWNVPQQTGMPTQIPMSSPPGYPAATANTSASLVPAGSMMSLLTSQNPDMGSSHLVQHSGFIPAPSTTPLGSPGYMGPLSNTTSSQLAIQHTPQMAVDAPARPPSAQVNYTVPTPQPDDLGAVGGLDHTTDLDYDRQASFSEINTEEMTDSIKQLSLTTIEDLITIKTEPNIINEPFPNQARQPPAYPNSGPALNVQAPSPAHLQQVQSPPQQPVGMSDIVEIMDPVHPAILAFPDQSTSIPSFDLNDSFVNSGQPELEDIVNRNVPN